MTSSLILDGIAQSRPITDYSDSGVLRGTREMIPERSQKSYMI